MRSSVIFAGSLVGRYKKATFSYPGGCDIGTRPIDLHLKAFEKLGINIQKNYGNISCICDKITGEKIIKEIKINKEVVDPEDIETLQDLILTCINGAIQKADNAASESMGKFNIPGLM